MQQAFFVQFLEAHEVEQVGGAGQAVPPFKFDVTHALLGDQVTMAIPEHPGEPLPTQDF
ncbi:hypothetical protein [Chromobacterium sp. IIBBL 290-4]|uniref:hypothetical protein n=1 Tax=Chromobacterium sp. IIBBL 290-4 TaxID=2953890 RepID=UPI0020B8F804|nr:hypothetical protein [Chromobacterium sp. IIBBL 290-4]UTH74970.1 hypothetical protein NKT35_02370 [Chromobacterium sp. IIBBL 290-4]